jgi:hypothetical protein
MRGPCAGFLFHCYSRPKGMRSAQVGADAAAKSTGGLTMSLGGVAKAALGLGIAKQLAGEIGKSFEQMAKVVQDAAYQVLG